MILRINRQDFTAQYPVKLYEGFITVYKFKRKNEPQDTQNPKDK